MGFVEFSNPALDPDREDIVAAFARTRTLVAIVVRTNREPIRSPTRSIANLEFHAATDRANEMAQALVGELERRGISALNPSAGFPMEMERFPGKTWIVSHKLVAQAAGLGRIGIHRNLIHPRFGSFVLLATVLVAAPIDEPGAPLDFNPCVSCKLCVACPVGAISPEGRFDFAACYTHNYREFMGGFGDWVESIAESNSARIGFTFRGASTAQATVVVEKGEVRVLHGLDGELDTHVTADSAAWSGVLRRERKLLWQLLARRIGIRGSVAQLRRFQACFVL